MATVRYQVESAASECVVEAPADLPDTIEERRARRMTALRKAAGIWANRTDIPADGLEYQRDMRAEWR